MFYSWALGNLVLSFLNVLFALAALVILFLFLLVGYKRRSLVGPSIAFAIGLVGIMVFIIWSDMRLPMTMINYKTILHIVILAIQLSLIILAIVRMPVYKQHSNEHHSNQHNYPYHRQYTPLIYTGINSPVPAQITDNNNELSY